MLVPLQKECFAQYARFAYALALDPACASYPAYFDGVKTETDFLRAAREAMESQTAEVLLYLRGNRVAGWLQYFWLARERYLQLTACCVEEGSENALTEFLAHVHARFPSYSCVCGFPAENTQALGCLRAYGFVLSERACNNIWFSAPRAPDAPEKQLTSVTRENYERFRALHEPVEAGMFWTAERLFAALDEWQILLLETDGTDMGAVYMTGEDGALEIFGVDLAPGAPSEAFRALLNGALDEARRLGARYVTFFCEPEHQADALAADFSFVGEYVCMEKRM